MAEAFSVEIEPEAVEDIQKAIDYYNHQKSGLVPYRLNSCFFGQNLPGKVLWQNL
ncbi:MAG: hypothetical protein V5A51_11255 [Bacteroidales bacterium]|nr:hypothetical protein [Bacteroidales bacterium]